MEKKWEAMDGMEHGKVGVKKENLRTYLVRLPSLSFIVIFVADV